jgi:lipopolysaccharide transport system ATP-binding protein
MGLPAIEIEGVSKAYRLYPTPRHRALELMTFGTRTYHTNFWALTDVSLRIARAPRSALSATTGRGRAPSSS